MICPKCKSKIVQPITEDKQKFYCVDCNYSWKKENSDKEPEGTLEFNGIPAARQIFEVLTKGQEFTPEFRAALESQVTALLLDQWFEGMKAGQMASILYAKEHYGKGRDEPKGTACTCKTKSQGDGRVGQNRRTRRSQDTSNPGNEGLSPTIRERVNGGELTYPRNLKLPENMLQQVALMIEDCPGVLTKKYHWDGRKLTVEVDW